MNAPKPNAPKRSTTAALLIALALAILAYALARGADDDASYRLDTPMVTHLQAGMHEQDVFLARDGGAFRVTAADEDPSAPLYASAQVVDHNPADPDDIGPYAVGGALGLTQGAWLAGRGNLTVACAEGHGRVNAVFENLVPNAVYTLWQSHVALPPSAPLKAIDLPLGAPDGSQNAFRTDDSGAAVFEAELDACVPLSSDRLATVLGIAYHSDGRTYGAEPGDFGKSSHVQLFSFLPTGAQLDAQAR